MSNTNLGDSAETNVLFTSSVKFNDSKANYMELLLPVHGNDNAGLGQIFLRGLGVIETLGYLRLSSGTDLNDVLLNTRRYQVMLNATTFDFEIFDVVNNTVRMTINATTGATTFNPPLAGITASTIATTESNTFGNFFLPFVSNFTTSASQSVLTNGFLYYNPSTQNLISTIMSPATLSFDALISGNRKWGITGSSDLTMVAHSNTFPYATNGCAFTISDTGLVSILGSTSSPTTGLRLFDRTTSANYWDTFSTAGTTLTNQYNGTTKKTLTNNGFMTLSGSNTGLRLSDRTNNTNFWDSFSTAGTLTSQYNSVTKTSLSTDGDFKTSGAFNGHTVSDRTTSANTWSMYADGGASTTFRIFTSVTAADRLTLSTAGILRILGTTPVLQIDDITSSANNWKFFSTGSVLQIQYNGTSKAILTNDGNFQVGGQFCGVRVDDRSLGETRGFQWYVTSGIFRAFSQNTAQDVFQATDAGACNNRTGVWGTIPSDVRLKENVSTAREYLDDINKLRVVKYSLIEDKLPEANMLGFISQEMEQVFPNLIFEQEGIKGIKTSILTPMLVSCVQELTKKNNALETKVSTLEERLILLENKMNAMINERTSV